ncbi:MAG: hypothetical protein ABH864_00865 [archaeon]
MANQILLAAAIIALAIIIYWLIKSREKGKNKSLFGDGLAVDVIPKKEAMGKSILIADIESIIKSSEQLDKILSSSGEGGKIYEKILLDNQLVSQIRNAKNKKEVEKILVDWTKGQISKNSSGEGDGTKGNGTDQKTPAQVANVIKKKINKAPKKKAESKTEQTSTKTSGKKQWAGKSREIYEEIESLLKSNNIEKLIEVIKKLSDNQIQTILKHYFENFEESKFGALLQRSKSAGDVTNLLKTETVRGLELEYERLKNNLAVARRQGRNTKNEELALISIPHKIKMFQATFDKKDFYKVRDSLIKIERSLEEKTEEAPKKDETKTT